MACSTMWIKGPGVRVLKLAFQEPRGHLDAHPSLQGRKVGRRREDLLALDPAIDRVGEVVREHLYLARKAARSEEAYRRASGDRAAHDVVDIGAFLQRFLDQDQLDFAAGIAPLPHDDVDRAAGECLGESLLDEVGPLRFPRAGEPRHLDRRRAGRMEAGEIGARDLSHRNPGDGGLGTDAGVGDVVDHGEHGNLLADREHRLGQPVEAHRSQRQDVRVLGAFGDLGNLAFEVGVAAGLDHAERDAQPLRLLHHAVVDAQPVRVLQVGI